MEAEDKDPKEMGGTVTYQFVSTPGEKERFHVDPETGDITTADVSKILWFYLLFIHLPLSFKNPGIRLSESFKASDITNQLTCGLLSGQ